jgi:intracellular septation protein
MMQIEHAPGAAGNQKLKMALEFGPMLVFLLGYAFSGLLAKMFPLLANVGGPLFIAKLLLMIATVISLVVSYILTRTLPRLPLVSGIFVLVFGTFALWSHNDLFIKLKPTVLNATFGAILLAGLVFNKSLLGYLLSPVLKLDTEGWNKLTLRWGLFFLFLAGLNEVIWRNFSENFWVNYSVMGTLAMTMIFMLCQAPLLMRHGEDNEPPTLPPSPGAS